MRTGVIGVVLLAAIVSVGAPCSAATAWSRVWQSETAAERVTVVGEARTMVVQDGGELAATAMVSSAGGKTRFDYRAGRRRWSLVDDGKALIELDPRRQRARLQERPRLAVDRALAERNYTAKETGREVIAGRPTTAVAIAPRAGGPAVLRLWLDNETGFALKRERHNAEGRLVSATEYSKVAFGGSVSEDLFAVPPSFVIAYRPPPAEKLTVEGLRERVGFEVSAPGHLPAGFVLTGGYVGEWGRWGLQAAELRYTDGIRVLSVYERQHRGERDGGRRRHGRRGWGEGDGRGRRGGRGGERGHGRGGGGGGGFGPPGEEMSFSDRGYEKAVRLLGPSVVVIVVGDLTREELERVARSVAQR
ncbi:MAG: sigma-E factor regulatory protein RseB domain-containing protein [Armatimonadota bacterium]